MLITKYDTARLNQIEFSLVAERYGGKVKRVGSNLYAECPWHNDEHPSLLIGGRKGNFCHCFSCGKSGGVIDYVMAVRNMDFKEACEELSREFGIEQTHPSPPCEGGGGCARKEKRRRKKGLKEMEALINSNLPSPLPHREGRGGSLGDWYETYLAEHDAYGSSFVECLRSVVTEEGVRFAVEEYRLGCWGDGYVMFPSIGLDGVVHNIKIQKYCTDKGSERFFHKLEKSTYWLAAILRKQGVFA